MCTRKTRDAICFHSIFIVLFTGFFFFAVTIVPALVNKAKVDGCQASSVQKTRHIDTRRWYDISVTESTQIKNDKPVFTFIGGLRIDPAAFLATHRYLPVWTFVVNWLDWKGRKRRVLFGSTRTSPSMSSTGLPFSLSHSSSGAGRPNAVQGTDIPSVFEKTALFGGSDMNTGPMTLCESSSGFSAETRGLEISHWSEIENNNNNNSR